MAADVMHSTAVKPGLASINGYQAWCPMHPEDGALAFIGGDLVDGVWLGEWHPTWIDARLDAVAHNMVKHPHSYCPLPTDWTLW